MSGNNNIENKNYGYEYRIENTSKIKSKNCCSRLIERRAKEIQIQKKMLIDDSFPDNWLKGVATIFFLLGVSVISLQIILLVRESNYTLIPVGLWAGPLLIVTCILIFIIGENPIINAQ